MKKSAFLLAATAAIAVPSVANAKAYVQVQTGLDSVSVEGSSDEGIAFGGALGYEMPISEKMFVGIEGSFDDSSTKECESDIFVLGDKACVKTGRDLSAVLRFGANVSPKTQLYALAGYTNARIKVSYTDGVDSFSEGGNGDGVRVGAGVKQDFGMFFGKLEYRYSNYESDFSRHNALLALGMNF